MKNGITRRPTFEKYAEKCMHCFRTSFLPNDIQLSGLKKFVMEEKIEPETDQIKRVKLVIRLKNAAKKKSFVIVLMDIEQMRKRFLMKVLQFYQDWKKKENKIWKINSWKTQKFESNFSNKSLLEQQKVFVELDMIEQDNWKGWLLIDSMKIYFIMV